MRFTYLAGFAGRYDERPCRTAGLPPPHLTGESMSRTIGAARGPGRARRIRPCFASTGPANGERRRSDQSLSRHPRSSDRAPRSAISMLPLQRGSYEYRHLATPRRQDQAVRTARVLPDIAEPSHHSRRTSGTVSGSRSAAKALSSTEDAASSPLFVREQRSAAEHREVGMGQ